jgi:hypothetical protein
MTMDEIARDDVKQLVERWRLAAPALEAQRLDELAALTDEQAKQMTSDLFSLWRPAATDDFGAELVEHQRVFRLWRERGEHCP